MNFHSFTVSISFQHSQIQQNSRGRFPSFGSRLPIGLVAETWPSSLEVQSRRDRGRRGIRKSDRTSNPDRSREFLRREIVRRTRLESFRAHGGRANPYYWIVKADNRFDNMVSYRVIKMSDKKQYFLFISPIMC